MDAETLKNKLLAGKATNEDLKEVDVSRSIRESMLERPKDWAQYIDDRLNRRFVSNSEVSEHFDAYTQKLNVSSYNLKYVNRMLKLQTKRLLSKLEVEQGKLESWKEREEKAKAAVQVLMGYADVDTVAVQQNIPRRTLYRNVIKMCGMGGHPVKGMRDIKALSIPERKAIAKIAMIEFEKEIEQYMKDQIRGDIRYKRK